MDVPARLIAAVTQTEAIVWSILGFAYLLCLLVFVRTLLRGPKPLHWRGWRVGVYLERTPDGKEEE